MRSISAALLAHLQGDVRTVATLFLVQRTDGQVFGFTDHDQDIAFNGVTYSSAAGYTHSGVDSTSTLATSNLEVTAILDSGVITRTSLESGVWDYAQVTIALCNYNDLTQGQVILNGGVLGSVSIYHGSYTAELRGLAQTMQQDSGDMYSPTCRATFGDSKCTINLAPLTFNGAVASINTATSFNDPTLTQSGGATAFIDSMGHYIPTRAPFTIQVVPPAGGAFVGNTDVRDEAGNSWTPGSIGNDQYTVTPTGLYTFDGTNNPGQFVYIDYTYTQGYFSYGALTWLTGSNAGATHEVKTFAPGVVTLGLQPVFAMQPGDTYSIVAGCDKQSGTCSGRWNNLLNFRGEPFIPGQDTMLSVKD